MLLWLLLLIKKCLCLLLLFLLVKNMLCYSCFECCYGLLCLRGIINIGDILGQHPTRRGRAAQKARRWQATASSLHARRRQPRRRSCLASSRSKASAPAVLAHSATTPTSLLRQSRLLLRRQRGRRLAAAAHLQSGSVLLDRSRRSLVQLWLQVVQTAPIVVPRLVRHIVKALMRARSIGILPQRSTVANRTCGPPGFQLRSVPSRESFDCPRSFELRSEPLFSAEMLTTPAPRISSIG